MNHDRNIASGSSSVSRAVVSGSSPWRASGAWGSVARHGFLGGCAPPVPQAILRFISRRASPCRRCSPGVMSGALLILARGFCTVTIADLRGPSSLAGDGTLEESVLGWVLPP